MILTIALLQKIMTDLENPNYDNIHISILQNYIQLLFAIDNKKLKDILDDTLLPCVWNINKKGKISYNLTENQDSSIYLDEYINTIVRLIFSFNSFLLNFTYNYCEDNKINYYDSFPNKNNPPNATNESLIEMRNNRNTITELLIFLYKQKLIPKNLIYVFSLYENIFRHQYAHGWGLFFYQLLKELPNLYTYFDYDKNDTNFILTDQTKIKTHGDIRKILKLRSLKKTDSINILPYMKFFPSDYFTDIDEELTFSINHKLDPKSVIALKEFGIETQYKIDEEDFDMIDWYKDNEGRIEEFDLHLQALATKIYAAVSSINENNKNT